MEQEVGYLPYLAMRGSQMSELPCLASSRISNERRGFCNQDNDWEPRFWPTRPNPVLAWLANATYGERYLDNIFFDLCRRLEMQGVPIARASVFLEIDHPQWCSLQVLWRHGMNQPKLILSAFGTKSADPLYERSQAVTCDRRREFRIRPHELAAASEDEALSECLRRECLTDYVAWPLPFTLGKCQMIYFATDSACGFEDDHLLELAELLPVLSTVMEVRMKNRLARDLLDTYVGPHAGEAILAGATRRGDGVTVEAAVIVVDLRGFTSISEQWPRDHVIAMLNDYFDALSDPIERHGGEILKFMGDGLLAMFPGDAAAASRAVVDICKAMASLNAAREKDWARALDFGVGVNYGDVMYGNIGSRNRLDFTVIGPAVNVAARLEALTKFVGRNVLFSAAFAAKAGQCIDLECFGTFDLRGVARPIEVYGLADSIRNNPEACPGRNNCADITDCTLNAFGEVRGAERVGHDRQFGGDEIGEAFCQT
jgi:adenylate cyclase